MLIENISTERIHLGFIRSGVTLNPGEIYDSPDDVVENPTFKSLENNNIIVIRAFDPDFTRYALREEVTPSTALPPGVPIEESTSYDASVSGGGTVNLIQLQQGRRLKEVTLDVTEAFSPATTISVGFFGNPEEIFPSNFNVPQLVNRYVVEPNRVAIVNELLILFINGNPTQGKVTVIIDEVL